MANGFTNKGLFRREQAYYRNTSVPTNFYIALVTSAVTPDKDTNTLSQLTQIATGNGYTDGGFQLVRNSTDFDTMTEDDTNDRVDTLIKNVAWTASGGSIPSGGSGARWAVMTDDNGTVGSREILAWWDLGSDRSVTVGNALTLADLGIRATNP